MPSTRVSLEGNQVVVDQLLQELIGEERIAASLLVYDLRERPCAFERTMKCVREPLGQIFIVERPKHDVPHDSTVFTDRRERPCERVRHVDLIVPIRTDEE